MRRFSRPSYIFTAICALGLSAAAHGQSLVITDCQGFTRASKQVQPGSSNSIEVQVTDTSGVSAGEGSTATLTNQATGEVTNAIIRGGLVRFEGIGPGVHAIEIESQSLIIGAITTSSAEIGVLGAGAALLGAGAAGGGVIVGSAALVDKVDDELGGGSDDDGRNRATPTPEPTPTTPPTPTRVPPTPTPDDCPQCEPDLTPPPLDDPFPTDQLPARSAARRGELSDPTYAPAASRLSPFD